MHTSAVDVSTLEAVREVDLVGPPLFPERGPGVRIEGLRFHS